MIRDVLSRETPDMTCHDDMHMFVLWLRSLGVGWGGAGGSWWVGGVRGVGGAGLGWGVICEYGMPGGRLCLCICVNCRWRVPSDISTGVLFEDVLCHSANFDVPPFHISAVQRGYWQAAHEVAPPNTHWHCYWLWSVDKHLWLAHLFRPGRGIYVFTDIIVSVCLNIIYKHKTL